MQQASNLPTDAPTFSLSSPSCPQVCPCTLAKAIPAEPIKSLCLCVFLHLCLFPFSHTNANFIYCVLQAISSGRPLQSNRHELAREISVQE